MNSARHFAVAVLLAFAISGCRHATAPPPPQAQAPTIKTTPATPPPSANPLTTQSEPPLPSLPATTEDASKHAPPAPAKPKHVHHKPKSADGDTPATTAAGTQPPAATGTAAAPATPPASPTALTPRALTPPPVQTADNTSAPTIPSSIGLLSTGDTTTASQTRHDTVTLIDTTTNGLNSIKRVLSNQEQQVAADIRTFLQKAKAALDTDDLDGAHTLATKAKVLLDELTKQ